LINITKNDVIFFQDNGWVNVNLNVEDSLLDNCINSVSIMKKKVIDKKWDFSRLYYDYLFGERNLAAVELPLHKNITKRPIENLFEEIKLGEAICTLTNWPSTYLSLFRIFTMGPRKYRGQYHRDFDPKLPVRENLSYIQVALFIDNQPGFRLLKLKHDVSGNEEILNFQDNEFVNSQEGYFLRKGYPLSLDKKYLDILDGKKGTVTFFNPSTFHQGVSHKKRTDFHMRFQNMLNVPNDVDYQKSVGDFFVAPEYSKTSNIDKLRKSKIPMDFKMNRGKLISRAYREFNYWFPVKPLFDKTFKKVSNNKIPYPFQIDYFANTFFQKD